MAKLYETHALAAVDMPDDAIVLPREAPELAPARPAALPMIRPDLQPAPPAGHGEAEAGGAPAAGPNPGQPTDRTAPTSAATADCTTPTGWLAPLGDAISAARAERTTTEAAAHL